MASSKVGILTELHLNMCTTLAVEPKLQHASERQCGHMSRLIRTSVVVLIVLVCFALSIAVAKSSLAPCECRQVDHVDLTVSRACQSFQTRRGDGFTEC
jgi:hypothetical protein